MAAHPVDEVYILLSQLYQRLDMGCNGSCLTRLAATGVTC